MGYQDEEGSPLGSEPPQLRSGARVWWMSLRATISSFATVRGAASSTRRPRSTPLPVALSIQAMCVASAATIWSASRDEGAAVDHREAVRLARVGHQLVDLVVAAAR